MFPRDSGRDNTMKASEWHPALTQMHPVFCWAMKVKHDCVRRRSCLAKARPAKHRVFSLDSGLRGVYRRREYPKKATGADTMLQQSRGEMPTNVLAASVPHHRRVRVQQ